MPVRIITDSGSEYKSSDHPALEVLPLTVAFGDDVYREGVDITYDQFYELLAEREEFPSTGQATAVPVPRSPRARSRGRRGRGDHYHVQSPVRYVSKCVHGGHCRP